MVVGLGNHIHIIDEQGGLYILSVFGYFYRKIFNPYCFASLIKNLWSSYLFMDSLCFYIPFLTQKPPEDKSISSIIVIHCLFLLQNYYYHIILLQLFYNILFNNWLNYLKQPIINCQHRYQIVPGCKFSCYDFVTDAVSVHFIIVWHRQMNFCTLWWVVSFGKTVTLKTKEWRAKPSSSFLNANCCPCVQYHI